MDIKKKVKKQIREWVTVERVAIGVCSIVMYTYVMDKRGYRMVQPAYVTDERFVFNKAFGGTTSIRFKK